MANTDKPMNETDDNANSGTDVLVIIDAQVDFTTGALGNELAASKIDGIEKKALSFDGVVMLTKDTHGESYMDTLEGHNLPIAHCISGTPGHDLDGDLEKDAEENGWRIFEKPTFGSVELAEALVKMNSATPIKSIELIGFCTDICVVSNALLIKAFLPDVPIKVDGDLCAGTTPEAHEAALATMRSCQIDC